MVHTPQPGAIYGARELGELLGLKPATVRWHLHYGTAAFPKPHGKIGGSWVWRGEDLVTAIPAYDAARAAAPTVATEDEVAAPSTSSAAAPDSDGVWWED